MGYCLMEEVLILPEPWYIVAGIFIVVMVALGGGLQLVLSVTSWYSDSKLLEMKRLERARFPKLTLAEQTAMEQQVAAEIRKIAPRPAVPKSPPPPPRPTLEESKAAARAKLGRQ